MRARPLILLFLIFVVGCATQTPDAIRNAPPVDLPLSLVQHDVSPYIGQPVRWGGQIAGVENRKNETWFDVVARPLDSNGRPNATGDSLGRFLVYTEGFLDPEVYAKGRDITIAGRIERSLIRPIGEYSYNYVVIKADTINLWEQRVERTPYYRDPFYDPFYDPFWPSRIYPWYAPYPFYPYWR